MIKQGANCQNYLKANNCKSPEKLTQNILIIDKHSQVINEDSEQNKKSSEGSDKDLAIEKPIKIVKESFKNMNRALKSSQNSSVRILKHKSQERTNQIEKPENKFQDSCIQKKPHIKFDNSIINRNDKKPENKFQDSCIQEKPHIKFSNSIINKNDKKLEIEEIKNENLFKPKPQQKIEPKQQRNFPNKLPQNRQKSLPKLQPKPKPQTPAPVVSNLIRDSMSYEELLKLDKDLYNKGNGLSIEKLTQLVPFKCNQLSTCPICQEEITENQSCCALQCLEKFHYDCLWDWLSRRKRCPVCLIEVMI